MSEQPTQPTLHDFSEGLANAVEATSPSVVAVFGRRRLPGTGVIWQVDDDAVWVVTASHVVEREDNLSVGLADGQQLSATVQGRDVSRDLAVLKIAHGTFTPIPRQEHAVRVGQIGLALGRPGTTSIKATFGIVTAVGCPPWRLNANVKLVHAEVTFLPGFSGGPLINPAGEMVGINTSGLTRRGGVTIPVDQVRRITADIITFGYPRAGWIGVTVQPATIAEHLRESVGDQEIGLLIVGVAPESPAATAGLMVGDMLVTLADQTLSDVGDLQLLLDGDQIGNVLNAGILRGGTVTSIEITPIERPGQQRR
jgi:S1-C subfamily serine protease